MQSKHLLKNESVVSSCPNEDPQIDLLLKFKAPQLYPPAGPIDTVNMHIGVGQSRIDWLVLNQWLFIVNSKTTQSNLD